MDPAPEKHIIPSLQNFISKNLNAQISTTRDPKLSPFF
jgi:hypothetical protein